MIFAMYTTCEEKQRVVIARFSKCTSDEEKYKELIALGRALSPVNPLYKTDENLVRGCQSKMYLHSSLKEGRMRFEAESDALISSGLAALLLLVYDDETPEAILKCPPSFLDTIGISSSLTPNRSNGLYSLHLRMKQEALKALLSEARSGGNHSQ